MKKVRVLAMVCTFLCLSVFAFAEDGGGKTLSITKASVNYLNGTIVITGKNFLRANGKTPIVTLSGTALTLVGAPTATGLVADFPGNTIPAAGEYPLVVGANGAKDSNGDNGNSDSLSLTIGAAGMQGPVGPTGPTGSTGVAGAAGVAGPVGPKGDTGAAGTNAPAGEYGVATVAVKRGTGAASNWAVYSTRLGSPVGDTTSGTFRFTCTGANAPCTVAVNAAVLSDVAGTTWGVWPRVLIQRQDNLTAGLPTVSTSAPQKYCEYGDGAFSVTSFYDGASILASPGFFGEVATQLSTPLPTYTALPINIGGSADCAGVYSPPFVASVSVPSISVPAGYYDVFSTFVFFKKP